MIDIKELRRKLGSDDLIDHIDIHANVKPVLTELINRIEAAEADALEQARLNGMGASREAALMAKLEAVEKERDALRARIEAMEKQESVASVWRCDNGHIHGSCERTLPMGAKLYALPGAKGE